MRDVIHLYCLLNFDICTLFPATAYEASTAALGNKAFVRDDIQNVDDDGEF